jgi:ribosomal-protein-alanine N-acetyltransferase
MQYIGVPLAKSVDEIEILVRKTKEQAVNNEGAAWALTLKNDGRMIGIAAYRKLVKEHYRGEIGYALHPSFRGMNLMYEALGAVIAYGFHTLGLHSIEANVDKENAASIKLLERLHFLREAHFRENYYFEGKFIDSVIYSLVAP